MAEIFYQGEDIVIDIDFYTDDTMATVVPINEINVDMIFYTRSDEFIVSASTIEGADLLISVINGLSLKVKIPSDITKKFTAGELTVELKVRDNIKESTRINVVSGVTIASSKIGKL